MKKIDPQTAQAGSNKVIRRVLTGLNINQTNTDIGTITGLPAKYRVRKVSFFDASADLTLSLATVGLFTAAAGAGSGLVALALIQALTGATKITDMTVVGTDYQTAATLYLRVGVTNGAAATVSAAVEIEDLT